MNESWAKVIAALWDRIAAVVCLIGGAGMVIAGYFGLSVRLDTAAQLPYIMSGGIGGLLVIGVGATLWISADLRDEWRKLDEIADMLAQGSDTDGRTDDGEPKQEETSEQALELEVEEAEEVV